MEHIYIAIDLKSFYASVECMERGLDPLKTNLVVADVSRTEKTICLAVSPSLKAYGIPGRARLFEVVQKVREVNRARLGNTSAGAFAGKSHQDDELKKNPDLELDYIAAPPQMAKYMEVSSRIYQTYLTFVAPEDIHVYSIDEVMMDVTDYLKTYRLSARELAGRMIQAVYQATGITATAGIGTNLYLCKVAMDIVAKHVEPDENGVRIASLDEITYRKLLWSHRPLTDFWRVGRGYAKKLEQYGMYTMGDIARCSIGTERDYQNEELLYKLFGVNAELLIDHAWGWEPCTMKEIKAYKPESSSIGSGQVLHCPYTKAKARIIVQEMIDHLVLDLVEKKLMTDQIIVTIGYDVESLRDTSYQGEITIDRYGRKIPKHTHGTVNLSRMTSSTSDIMEKVMDFYDREVSAQLLIRRVNLAANHVEDEKKVKESPQFEQLSLFDMGLGTKPDPEEEKKQEKERKLQEAMLSIKQKFGKNAILKGTSLEEGATMIERNSQIGGHKA